MTFDAKALNMVDYYLICEDTLTRAVTFSLIENGSVMADIPFMTRQLMIANGVRFEGNLPTVTWANINEPGTVTKGTPTPFQEQIYLIRNYIDTDKILVMDQAQVVDPRATQVSAYMKSAAFDFNDKFLNNSHESGDAKSIVGIRTRIDNGSKYGVRSENKIDANGVNMTSGAGLTAATFGAFLEYVDQLLWSIDAPDGMNCVLYVNEVMWRRWDRAARQFSGQGGFTISTDQLGRSVTRYKNAIIRDIGYKADQTTRIITTTENADGTDGSSTYTSIYGVHLGETHLSGWQFEPLMARDLGLVQPDNKFYRTDIDWAGGLYNAHTRSMGRVFNIKLA